MNETVYLDRTGKPVAAYLVKDRCEGRPHDLVEAGPRGIRVCRRCEAIVLTSEAYERLIKEEHQNERDQQDADTDRSRRLSEAGGDGLQRPA